MSSKISDLSDGGAIQSTDQLVVARSGANYKIAGSQIGNASAVVFSGAKATRSSDQSISATTSTAITWDTEEFDTDGYHSTSSNTSRLTVPTTAKYQITGNVRFAAGESGFLSIQKNGDGTAGVLAQAGIAGAAGDEFNAATVTVDASLAATDYVELVVYTNTASSVKAGASGGYGQASFSIRRLDTAQGVNSFSVTQTAHGLAVGNPVRFNGTNYVKAQADSVTNAEVIGIVSAVPDANTFSLSTGGDITGLSGLTAGSVYYLSASSAGALTATEPTTTGQISKPVLIARSTTAGTFVNFRGAVISAGGAVSTTVTQANSFAVGDVLYYTGSAYAKAQADTTAHAEVVGIVASADSSSFIMTTSGVVTGLSGLTAGTVYYLSAATAGAITATAPSLSKPVLVAISTTSGVFSFSYRGLIGADSTGSTSAGIGYNPLTSSAIGSSNIFAVRVWLPVRATFTKYLFRIATQSGNMDLGVYDASGAAVRREGSFTVPATGRATRTLGGGSLTLEPGEYILAAQMDNATASIGLISASNQETIAYTPTNTFPLPSTMTLTVGGTGIALMLIP